MKKVLSLLLAGALALCLAACGTPAASSAATEPTAAPASAETAGEPVELVVFAAASLTETLNEIASDYKTVAPDVTLTFNFDSSGTLKTQIQEGAVCDVFLSAAPKQMDQLDAAADPAVNTEGLDFVDDATRLDLLENRVSLCVPSDNPADIESFDDLARKLTDGGILMAMGNSDVPVGQYTQKILAHYGLDEQTLADAGVLSYGTNVKEVTTQIAEGSVDCGVVYATDACSAGLTVVDTATEALCGRVIYPAAVLKTSAHPQEARAFLDYLSTPQAMAVFEAVGFTAP